MRLQHDGRGRLTPAGRRGGAESMQAGAQRLDGAARQQAPVRRVGDLDRHGRAVGERELRGRRGAAGHRESVERRRPGSTSARRVDPTTARARGRCAWPTRTTGPSRWSGTREERHVEAARACTSSSRSSATGSRPALNLRTAPCCGAAAYTLPHSSVSSEVSSIGARGRIGRPAAAAAPCQSAARCGGCGRRPRRRRAC